MIVLLQYTTAHLQFLFSLLHLGRITKGHSNNLSARVLDILLFINTTQLYSNLVIIEYYLSLSLPCVGCPDVSKDLKCQACLAAHQFPSSYHHLSSHTIHTQLGKHFPFIDLRRQRRTNTWSLKQRVSSAQWKQAFPVLPSLVKMASG